VGWGYRDEDTQPLHVPAEWTTGPRPFPARTARATPFGAPSAAAPGTPRTRSRVAVPALVAGALVAGRCSPVWSPAVARPARPPWGARCGRRSPAPCAPHRPVPPARPAAAARPTALPVRLPVRRQPPDPAPEAPWGRHLDRVPPPVPGLVRVAVHEQQAAGVSRGTGIGGSGLRRVGRNRPGRGQTHWPAAGEPGQGGPARWAGRRPGAAGTGRAGGPDRRAAGGCRARVRARRAARRPRRRPDGCGTPGCRVQPVGAPRRGRARGPACGHDRTPGRPAARAAGRRRAPRGRTGPAGRRRRRRAAGRGGAHRLLAAGQPADRRRATRGGCPD
jgi:hypothetical protein